VPIEEPVAVADSGYAVLHDIGSSSSYRPYMRGLSFGFPAAVYKSKTSDCTRIVIASTLAAGIRFPGSYD